MNLLLAIVVVSIAVALLGDAWKWVTEELVLAWGHSVALRRLNSVWGLSQLSEGGLWVGAGGGSSVEDLATAIASAVLSLLSASLWLSWDWGLAEALLSLAWGDITESALVAVDVVVLWVLLSESILESLVKVHLGVWSVVLGAVVHKLGEEYHTGTLALSSLLSALGNWSVITLVDSTLFETLGVEVLFGLDPSIIASSELLDQVLISIKIALGLLISNSWSAEFLSSLVNTPVLVVLLGSGEWLLLLPEMSKIVVSLKIAMGLSISHLMVAGLDSILLLTMLCPVELGLGDVSERVLLNDIWVSVEVALSLSISHVGSGDESLLLSSDLNSLLRGHHDEVSVT
jgi:hypothetical protein